MKQMSNEELCFLSKQGDPDALNLLIEKNLPYVRERAYELWNTQRELNQSLGIMPDNQIQEGSLSLYHCIKSYDPDSGNKFLTYASPAIYNAMLDYIRRQNTALNRIDLRERTYLWYRLGFEDDMEHPLTETAKHFHLSESRARSTEKAVKVFISS